MMDHCFKCGHFLMNGNNHSCGIECGCDYCGVGRQEMIDETSLEERLKQWSDELRAAGWKQVLRADVWKSPNGKLFGGPYLAWSIMKAEQARKSNSHRH